MIRYEDVPKRDVWGVIKSKMAKKEKKKFFKWQKNG